MEISELLFKFLVSFDIIPQEAIRLNNQLVRLPKEMSANFENAMYFAKIAKQINRIQHLKNNQPETPLPNVGSLKEGNQASAKLFNWNIVLTYLLKFDISVHPDQRTLIAAGDFQAANHLLTTIHHYVLKKYPDYQKFIVKTPAVLSPLKQKEKEKLDTIDLKKMTIDKDPLQTTSSLEFLTVLLSKCLHLTPNQLLTQQQLQNVFNLYENFLKNKQSASLFTENCKYLAHVIVKGVKGLFDPIVLLYQNLNTYYSHLLDLCVRDMKFIFIIMNGLKPGMVCKNDVVAQLACNLFFNFGVELNQRQLSNKAWDWFINENNNGLYTCIKCIKRHPKLSEEIVKIFYQYGQYNFVELFTTYLKVEIPDTKDHMHFICQIIQPISAHPFIIQEVLQNGIMEDWLEVAFECSQTYIQNELRLEALNFLAECWINHPKKIEEVESRANQIINGLVEGCNDASQSVLLGIDCMAQLFRLLMKLGKEKNSYAPKIYKVISTINQQFNYNVFLKTKQALSSILISSLDNINMREFSLVNFTEIFKEIPTIPVGIMLEPYITQIQVQEEVFEKLNVCDFEFLRFISAKTKFNDKLVVQLMDLLGKVLLNNAIFSNIVHNSLLELLNQYYEIPSIQNYLNKFIKITLAMYYASEKKKKPKEKILPLYNNQSASKSVVLAPNDIEQELINAQKRSKIVQILKSIAEIQCREINQKMKPLVAHTAIQLEDFQKKVNKGMMHVLESFGNPQEIIQEYRVEYENHMEQIKFRNKDLISQQQTFSSQQKKEQEEIEEKQDQENLQNMDENERKVTENVRKYGLGLKKKKIILSKEEQYRLAQLRKPQETDPKVLQILEDKKKEYISKQESEQKKKEAENQHLEKQKQQLRKQLEMRSIQQGVAAQNKPDMEANLLFEYDSREKEMKKEKKSGVPEINYFDLNLEEARDKTMVDIQLKKYYKLFRNLFIKYSNSTQTFDNQVKTFDKLKDRTQSITVAEVWKIIKDYELTQFISQEEHKTIFRLINTNYFNKKTDLQQLDYKGFEQYIIQFSYHFCSKPPQDLRHLPISCSIEKLIDYMKIVAKKLGQNIALFEDPDKLYFGESEVIQEFNKQLKEDPNIELPSGYKKVQEKELKFNYEIHPNLKLPLGIKYGYEILNDLFIQVIGFSLIEPKTEEKTQFKAQPQIKAKVNTQPQYLDVFKVQEQQREQQKANSKSPSPKGRQRITSTDKLNANGLNMVQLKIGNKVMNPILSTFGVQNKKYGSKRVLEIDQFKQLPVNLKVLVSKQNVKDRYTSEQVALVIDDIVDAIEQGKSSIRKQGLQGIQNHFQKSKEDQHNEKQKESQEQIKRIKERKIELNDQLEQLKKQKEEEEQKKKEEEKNKKNEVGKKKSIQDQKKKQTHLEQKSKIQEYNKQKEEQKKKEQEEKEKAEKEKRKKHNEQFEQFNQNNQQKLREEWQKKKQVSAEKQTEKEQLEEKQKSNLKKLHKKILEDNQQRVEQEQFQNQKIQSFLESPDTLEVFDQNENQISLIFDFLERYSFKQITNPSMVPGEIPLKVFSWFCFQFNLYPEIITPNEVILIFRSLIKSKPSINGAPIGLNKQEFLQALGKICIKGAKVFNKFLEKTDKNNHLEKNEMEDILKENEEEQLEKQIQEDQQQQFNDLNDQKNSSLIMNVNSSNVIQSPKKDQNSLNKIIDEYTYIDQTNSSTLQALFNYLAIPANKAEANNLFKKKLEQKHLPDSVRKRELLKKLNHDPSEFIQDKGNDKSRIKSGKYDHSSRKSVSVERENENSSIVLNNQMNKSKLKTNLNLKGDRSKSPVNNNSNYQINEQKNSSQLSQKNRDTLSESRNKQQEDSQQNDQQRQNIDIDQEDDIEKNQNDQNLEDNNNNNNEYNSAQSNIEQQQNQELDQNNIN